MTDRDRIIHILVVHYDMFRDKAEEAADLIIGPEPRIAKFEEFARWVRDAPVSSGVCCCGSDVESHTGYEGHGPVDQWDYSLGQWLEELGVDRSDN